MGVCRAVFSTQNKEADEGREQQMKMCWPNRTEEKMQSDWLKMKDNLIALQQVRKPLKVFNVISGSCGTTIIGLFA